MYARTLTAAVWFRFVHFATPRAPSSSCTSLASHMFTTLSFPPLASSAPSPRHVRPHTSPAWPSSSATLCRPTRTSWCQMLPSWQPLLSTCPLQLRLATCAWCPPITRSRFCAATSQSSTAPVPSPTPRNAPSPLNATLAIVLPSGAVASGATSPLSAAHAYAVSPSPTASTFAGDHASTFR
jgi:hypothetical protein